MANSLLRRRAPGELVFLAASVIAVILAAHIVFVLLSTNTANDIVHTCAVWAAWLATWFDDMFEPVNEKLEIFINYGIAAIFYLVVGSLLKTAVDRA